MIFNTESQEQNNQKKIERRVFLKKVGKAAMAIASIGVGLGTDPLNAQSQILQKNEDIKQLPEKTIEFKIRQIDDRLRSLIKKYSTCNEAAKLEIMKSVGELLTLQSSIPEDMNQRFDDQIGETTTLGIFMLHLDQNDWSIPISHRKETIHLKAFAEIKNFVDLKYTNVQYDTLGNVIKAEGYEVEKNIIFMGQIHFSDSHVAVLQNDPKLAKQTEKYLSRDDNSKTIRSQQNLVNALIPMIETTINISGGKAILGVEGLHSKMTGTDFELTDGEIASIKQNAVNKIAKYKREAEQNNDPNQRKKLNTSANLIERDLKQFTKNAFVQLEEKFGDSLITHGVDIQNVMSSEEISQLYLDYYTALYQFRNATVDLHQGKLSKVEAVKKADNLKTIYDIFMPLRDRIATVSLATLMQKNNTPVSFLIFGKGHGDGIRSAVNKYNTDSHFLKQLFGTEKARINLYYFTPKY